MTPERALRIGITGAGGFIGRSAVARFAAGGHEVHAYQRGATPAPPAGAIVHRFEMPDAIDPGSFDGLDVLIHAALVEYGPAHRDADRVNLACDRDQALRARITGGASSRSSAVTIRRATRSCDSGSCSGTAGCSAAWWT